MSNTKNAYRPKEFCERNTIGPTTFYKEIKAGRLKVLKCGKATFVTAEQEREWLASLPVVAK
jgi:predicted site-specific integrase-resolvase